MLILCLMQIVMGMFSFRIYKTLIDFYNTDQGTFAFGLVWNHAYNLVHVYEMSLKHSDNSD